jgi:hypothetical protein
MAHWALVAALLTGLGVVAVILTLRTALDANRGFKHSAEQQLSAYVIGEAFEVTQHFKYIEGFDVSWSFGLRNAGQTPAFDLTNVAKGGWATEQEVEEWNLSASPTSNAVLGPGRQLMVKGEFRAQGSQTMERFNGIDMAIKKSLKQTIWIRGVATYRDVNNRLWRHEYRWKVFDILRLAESSGGEKTRRIDLYGHATGNTLKVVEDPTDK